MSALGRRYATALLDLAKENGQTDKVAQDVTALSQAWASSEELRELARNPVVPRPAVKAAMAAVLERLGASQLLKSTVGVLGDRGRLRYLDEVLDDFGRLAEAERGRVRAEVTTAQPMPDAYYVELQQKLERITGNQVVLIKKHDPSLIGGVVTRVGDRVFDGSLRNQLDELKETLLFNAATP